MIGVVRNDLLAGKVIGGAWRHNESLRDVGYAILKKYNYKCYLCGIQSVPSKVYPDGMMIPIDIKHSGLAAGILKDGLCACPLCASSQAVNWSVVTTVMDGVEHSSAGFLVFFPYKSQADVNRLAIVTLVNSIKNASDPLFSVSIDVDVTMTRLANEIIKNVPIYRGNDADFVKALASISDEFYDKRKKIIGAIRWWPNLDYFSSFGKYIYAASLKNSGQEVGFESKSSKLAGIERD